MEFFYRVKKGDGIRSVSEKFTVSPFTIISINSLKNELYEGQVIIIKKTENIYTVKVGETLEKLLIKFNLSREEFIEKNGINFVYPDLIINI